jgi:hypothetical protein
VSCDCFLYLLLLAILLSHKFHLTHCSSKALLLAFIKSSNVSSILDASEVNRILNFLRNHVFPQKSFMLVASFCVLEASMHIPIRHMRELTGVSSTAR